MELVGYGRDRTQAFTSEHRFISEQKQGYF